MECFLFELRVAVLEVNSALCHPSSYTCLTKWHYSKVSLNIFDSLNNCYGFNLNVGWDVIFRVASARLNAKCID